MKKIAVLVSGEFRNFNITKKTIPILEHSRVSVFVSTWSAVNTTLFKNLTITEEVIKSYFQKPPIKISIDHLEKLNNNQIFPLPMINRWISGFNMIDNTHDVVLIMRPDLFFNPEQPITIDNISDCLGVIKFFNLNRHTSRTTLPDIGFCAEYNTMKELLSSLDKDWIKWYNNTPGWRNWHHWWFEHVSKRIGSGNLIAFQDDLIPICRDWCNEDHSFDDVIKIHHDFNYYKLIDYANNYGHKIVYQAYPTSFVKALNLYKSGHFDKYNID